MNYEFEGKYILEFDNGDSVEFNKIEFDNIECGRLEFNVWGDDLKTNPTLSNVLKKMDEIIEGRGYLKKQDICFDATLFEIIDNEKQLSMQLKCIVPITFGEYFAFAADFFIADDNNDMAMMIYYAQRKKIFDTMKIFDGIPVIDTSKTYHITEDTEDNGKWEWNDDIWDDDIEIKRPSFKQRLHNFFKAFIDLW